MSPGPHSLVLASAGTGKTYRLSGRFLELLLRGVEPGRILATTFTRKAAGEIIERVLERLVEAAENPAKLEELRASTNSPALTREECVRLLASLTRHLDRLQIRTLDAFFAHLARLFALDLDLVPDWRIADEREDAEIVVQAIARVLDEASDDERLELMRGLQRESAVRAVYPALTQVVANFHPGFLDSPVEAWERVPSREAPTAAELAAAREALAAMAIPQKAKGGADGRWTKARDKLLATWDASDLEALLKDGLLKKSREEPPKYFSKPISEETVAALAVGREQAVAELLARLRRQNAAAHGFLARFETAYRELQRERGAYRFGDLPQTLAPGPDGQDPIRARDLDLWFRLDARLDHLLLDEFQDTAPLQWRVLEPLVDEVLADGTGERSFFCVGDVKQSIYGWREAEPRLLSQLDRKYPVLAPPERLSTNWRSSPVVLGVVDELFSAVDESPLFAAEEHARLRAAASAWCAGFEPHVAARPDIKGCVELLESRPAREAEAAEFPALELAAERVAAIMEEAPAASVGILLRRKKFIPRLIYLLRERGVHASGEGGNPLVDSAAVNVVLSSLLLADHPGDTLAAFHVASSPLGPWLALNPAEIADAAGRRRAAPRAEELARELRARLSLEGYGGYVRAVLSAAQEGALFDPWERTRLAQLAELALAFDDQATLRPSDFVEHVRTEKVEDPSASAVRIMTIHASKGLEFDAVVLPELDVEWFKTYEPVLTWREDPFGAYTVVTNAPNKQLREDVAELETLHGEVRGRSLEESLSLLYVAMTRARRRLEMIVRWRDPAKPPRKPRLDWASLLRAGLMGDEPPEEGLLARRGDASALWAAGLEGRAAAPTVDDAPASLRRMAAGTRRTLELRTPSAEEGRASVRELLRREPAAALGRGSLVHRWLEELEWIEDFEPDDELLLSLGAEHIAERATRESLLAELRAGLREPAIHAALTREGRAPGRELSVERERDFELLLESDQGVTEFWRGAIDRLVVERESGRPIAAEVIDYKTDRVAGVDLEARIATYRPQIEAYRRAAAVITGLPLEAVKGRLLFLFGGESVEVSGS